MTETLLLDVCRIEIANRYNRAVFQFPRAAASDGPRWLSRCAGVAALALAACTPLNGPHDVTDAPSSQDAGADSLAADALATDASATDTAAERPADRPPDTSMDTAADRALDAPADSAADRAVDMPADVTVDTVADVTVDTAADRPADTPGDGAADTPGDAPTEAPGDAPPAMGCARFTRGPTMVAARMLTKPLCVDSTEVTQAQYQQFLTATEGDTSGQGPECLWNLNYAPVLMCNFDPDGHANYPVNGVDWCDATAYCKWAGKRLCGGPTGGPIETSSASLLEMSEVSEWTAVCSHGGERGFPYGTVFDGEACNGGEHSGTPRAIVGVETTPGCEGGYPGIFDMVGNVHEWENACFPVAGTPGRTDQCWFRSGSYHDPGNSCSSAWAVARDYVDADCDIGFRCCADP